MPPVDCYDFVIIGSGFGGSVSAMRLAEKGYRVLVLERGKRYNDADFPRTNWNIPNYLWLPALRCFGFFQMSLFRGFFVFHGGGVGGGSLVYAAVLMEPGDSFFDAPAWRDMADWKTVLRPHYDTARRMLGVAANPRLTPADEALREVAGQMGCGDTFRPTDVGIYFEEADQEAAVRSEPAVRSDPADPYFGGEGPARVGCTYCGGCMVGCRENAKNSLPKNYLFFAEKWGVEVRPECEVVDIQALGSPSIGAADEGGARYEVVYRSSTAWLLKPEQRLRARHVIVSAGVLGTHDLLLRCRDVTRSLPDLSPHLGDTVRTNSEAFLGAFSRSRQVDHSKGIAISSIFKADSSTQIEPVRYSEGSSLIFRLLSAPFIEGGGSFLRRLAKMLVQLVRRPLEFMDTKLIPGLTRRGTTLMIMQTHDNLMRLRLGRSLFTLFRKGLVADHDPQRTIPVDIDLGRRVTQDFARQIGGHPVGTLPEGLLNVPMTAHMLGGCLFGRDAQEGVVSLDCQVHNYPGLYVVDGSIVPANPGVNPSLTITALAEYAMSRIPPKAN